MVGAPRPERAVAAEPTARFVAAEPCRLTDVREKQGFKRLDDLIIRVQVVDRCGVPEGATAVALTITADASGIAAGGYVSAWPQEMPLSQTSIVNHWPREVRANGTIVGLGASGNLYVLSSAQAPVVIDVTGWFEPATTSTSGRFVPITPKRAIDTRERPRRAPLAPRETITVPLPKGVPVDATAVALTVTTTDSPGPGYLSVAPAGTEDVPSSVVNTDGPGQTRASGTIVGVTREGIDVFSLSGGHVIVDITGWFTNDTDPDSADGLFVAEPAPRRLLDTRGGDPVWRDGTVEIPNVAAGAAALMLNVTIVQPFVPGYVTAHAARRKQPPTSTVNGPTTGEVAAAMSIVPTSDVGVAFYSSGGADVVVDVFGRFTGTPPTGTGRAPTNVRPPECASGSDPDSLNGFFAAGVAFRGADYQRAFPLPDGRILWVFQDVFVRGRGATTSFVHNAALVQQGSCFTVLYNGNFASPDEYLFPNDTDRKDRWFWPLAGDMGADGMFHLFVAEMRERGPSYLSKTEPVATWRVRIDPATLQVVDAQPAADASAALYGWSIVSDSTYSYLYAHCHKQFGWDPFPFVSPPVYVHDFDCVQDVTVARVPRGRFEQPLQYWNGASWTSNRATAANIVPTGRLVSASQFYRTAPGKYVAITKVGDWFGETIEIDVASSPQGPFRTVRTIATGRRCPDCNTYFPSKLPYDAANGEWIIGLSNNRFSTTSLTHYDPTFFTIPPV